MEITLRGEPFPHLLFHYRLAWSGWAYGQVIHGGESFVALSEGLQNALAACGGAPQELRTDRLSAASRNRNGSYALDITPRYRRSALWFLGFLFPYRAVGLPFLP